ncbi:MAG: hypothetical protein MPJ50_14535 [Pirellulales bacterium]|nr:hypothetical protein [Pirellulales bacterium]
MEEQQLIHRWRYPVFVVRVEGELFLVCIDIEGRECLLLFTSKELAEHYVDGVKQEEKLQLMELDDDDELARLLQSVPDDVQHVVWDTTPSASLAKVAAIEDLLRVLESDPS